MNIGFDGRVISLVMGVLAAGLLVLFLPTILADQAGLSVGLSNVIGYILGMLALLGGAAASMFGPDNKR